ncbi:MAG: DUF4430 domain-containing protein [Solirubrobacterales bacterium]|nr:DUF4430 domain-containing protein [Solirubrobacterales bacterium]
MTRTLTAASARRLASMTTCRPRAVRPSRIAVVGALGALGALGAAGAAALLAGCGLVAGPATGGARLLVTREFGAVQMASASAVRVGGAETAMSLLTRNVAVTTRPGGGVESIDGRPGGHSGSAPVAWFHYVNGIAAPRGAGETTVHGGDVVWWDLHDYSQAPEVPAVVGSFPEPFLHGSEGERLPVRVECARVEAAACGTVVARMRALGVPAAIAQLGPAGEMPDTLRILVGPWSAVRAAPAAQQIEQGPRVSGVYARIPAGGDGLELLDANGRAVQTLGAGAGLIAATRYSGEEPVWVITGTDASGVERAARALDRSALHARFAVALAPSGAVLPLPAPGRSGE